MKSLIKENNLEKYEKQIIQLSKSAIQIITETVDDDEIEIGQSKFGGLPDLPNKIEFPKWKSKPLSFLAQINLNEISNYDSEKLLPENGFLYFFYDQEQSTWGFDPKEKDSFKVIYSETKVEDLKRAKKPKGLSIVYESCLLKYENKNNIPSYTSRYIDDLQLNEEEQDFYYNLEEAINFTGEDNKIFGYPNVIQGDVQYDCTLVSNGLYLGDTEGYLNPKVQEYLKEYDEWILLLQMDSDFTTDMMWGDMGRIYFYIKKDDLKNRNFNNVWFFLQCS